MVSTLQEAETHLNVGGREGWIEHGLGKLIFCEKFGLSIRNFEKKSEIPKKRPKRVRMLEIHIKCSLEFLH